MGETTIGAARGVSSGTSQDQSIADSKSTGRTSEKNPLPFFTVKRRIETALLPYHGRFVVVPLPNITNICYGRDVGYAVERILLDAETEVISATSMRQLSAAPSTAI